MSPQDFLDIQPEVVKAITEGQGVVALESTIISHGMPYPENRTTAKRVEQAVRDTGAIPATIAIIAGRFKVGLSDEELEFLAKSGPSVTKCSRRDLPFLIAKEGHGATTVAATMIIAAMAGIKLFATGGIGGVHRGAEHSMDISADLQELAQTNVAVVSAGAKAILDIGLTLEYLETMGVPVIGYKTDDFPMFYVRNSGFSVDYRLDDPKEVAKVLRLKWGMDLRGGVLVANPISREAALDNRIAQKAIDQAIAEAEHQGISGKAITPFLLGRIKELTKGKSLESNIELVLSNARVAGKIAVELSLL